MLVSKLKPDEISSIIREKVASFDLKIDVSQVGKVISYSDGVAKVYGLDEVMSYEMVEFDTGEAGIALGLEEDSVGVVILGEGRGIGQGTSVKRSHELMKIPVGEGVVGRVLDAVGNPLDGGPAVNGLAHAFIECKAPGIIDRKSVHEPLETGIKAIDALVPIGRGQRELIIGDRQTGKTTIAIDTIINQKGKDVICVYVAIGQKMSSVAHIVKKLEEHDAMKYTVIVSASASSPAAMRYLAPYSGVTMAEYFRDSGRHALVIYDDLTKHAVAYREMSLILRRPPGREALPGDIFYVHSRLLERAAKLNDSLGGGSLTALPIVETQAGDVSAYVPTNVISITDGQIFLDTDLFYSGVRPAINVGLSVSRVGGAAQVKSIKGVAGNLRLDLAQFRELQSFAQFASDLGDSSKSQLERGLRVSELLKQGPYSPIPSERQTVIIYAGVNGYLDSIPVGGVLDFESKLYSFITLNHPELFSEIKAQNAISDGIRSRLDSVLEEFKSSYLG